MLTGHSVCICFAGTKRRVSLAWNSCAIDGNALHIIIWSLPLELMVVEVEGS